MTQKSFNEKTVKENFERVIKNGLMQIEKKLSRRRMEDIEKSNKYKGI